MIPGYKPFFEKGPPAMVARVARVEPGLPENIRNPRNHSSTYSIKKTPDAEKLIERSAIQEYNADMKRNQANMKASTAYDAQRQSYELANPDQDPAVVEGLYQAYITDWQPTGPGDVPAVPPNTRGNGDLWRAWWAKVEAVK